MGYFGEPAEAARAYDKKVVQLHGALGEGHGLLVHLDKKTFIKLCIALYKHVVHSVYHMGALWYSWLTCTAYRSGTSDCGSPGACPLPWQCSDCIMDPAAATALAQHWDVSCIVATIHWIFQIAFAHDRIADSCLCLLIFTDLQYSDLASFCSVVGCLPVCCVPLHSGRQGPAVWLSNCAAAII